MATNLSGYRSWFNSTVYYTIEELEKVGGDPIFDLFGEINYSTRTGDTVNFTGRAFGGYSPIVPPGGNIPESNPTEGDQLAKTFLSVKDRMVVEVESFLHDKLDFVKEDASALVERCVSTPALVMSRALLAVPDATTVTLPNSNGLTYATACADTFQLAYASHTVPGAPGSTFSNVLSAASALDDTAISDVIEQGNANIVNDDGQVAPWRPDTLIIPRQEYMVRKAQELTKSDQVVMSPNNTINVYSGGRFKIVVLERLPATSVGAHTTTGQYYWALADSRMLKRAIKYCWAARPQDNVVPRFQSRENLDSTIATFGRFLFGFPRWQGIVFSLSSTAPTLG